jgi:hypothetical protein
MTVPFAHDSAPLAINRNAAKGVELAVAAAFAADGSNLGAVAVPQHLHTVILAVSYKDVPGAVEGKAANI